MLLFGTTVVCKERQHAIHTYLASPCSLGEERKKKCSNCWLWRSDAHNWFSSSTSWRSTCQGETKRRLDYLGITVLEDICFNKYVLHT